MEWKDYSLRTRRLVANISCYVTLARGWWANVLECYSISSDGSFGARFLQGRGPLRKEKKGKERGGGGGAVKEGGGGGAQSSELTLMSKAV